MYKVLDELKYAKTHEWVLLDGVEAIVGITDFAQASLGTVVYVEGYEVGEHVDQGAECGAVESVKAASDIMAPMSGTIVAINDAVINDPELLNKDPYANWILKIRIDNEDEINNLLDAESYKEEQK